MGEKRFESQMYPGVFLTSKGIPTDKDGNELKVSKRDDWYSTFTYQGRNIPLHRLIAEGFVPVLIEGDCEDFQINHYDGKKDNNQVSNLEWVTPSGNLIHAYQTGLRTDNTFIEIKDLRDGSVQEFYSISECARAFLLNPAALLHYLDPNITRLLSNFYLVRKKGEEWPKYSPDEIGKYRKGTPKPVLTRNLNENTYCIYVTLESAARDTGIESYLIRKILRTSKNKPYQGYIFTYIDNVFEFEAMSKTVEVVGEILPRSPRNTPPPLVEYGIRTIDRYGNKQDWDKVTDFANFLGVKKSAVQKAIGRGKEYRGFRLKYLK